MPRRSARRTPLLFLLPRGSPLTVSHRNLLLILYNIILYLFCQAYKQGFSHFFRKKEDAKASHLRPSKRRTPSFQFSKFNLLFSRFLKIYFNFYFGFSLNFPFYCARTRSELRLKEPSLLQAPTLSSRPSKYQKKPLTSTSTSVIIVKYRMRE